MYDSTPTATLIARGRHLVNVIAEAKTELETIEATLRQRALAMPHQPLAQGNREGRRAILQDAGQSVAVIFESDLLKASFDAGSSFAETLCTLLAKPQLDALFRLKKTYERIQKDGHKFRILAADVLGPDLSAKVIDHLKDRDKSGIVKSKSAVEWNGTKP